VERGVRRRGREEERQRRGEERKKWSRCGR